MQKQKIIKFLLLLSPIAWLVSLSTPAKAGATEWFANALGNVVADIVSVIVNLIAELLFPLLNSILSLALDKKNYLMEQDTVVQTIWEGSLTVANSLFLLALIIASVAIILRLNTGIYNIKKVLGGFIMAVVLSNFSLLIVRALIEIGDNLQIAVQFMFQPLGITESIVNSYVQALSNLRAPVLGANVEDAILVLITMALIFCVMLKLAMVLLERIFWIFLLAVAAPIVFAISLLPTTQKLAAQWWEKLIKWILVFPLTYALLTIAILMIDQAMQIFGQGSGSNISADALSDVLTDAGYIVDLSNNPAILFFICGLAILYLSGTTNKMLKIDESSISGAVSTPQKMVSGGISAGKKAWKGAADTATGKNLAGKALHSVYYGGRRQLLAGSYDKVPLLKNWKEKELKKEARRKLNTGGLRGMIWASKERGAKLDAESERNVEEATIKEQAERTAQTNTALQGATGARADELKGQLKSEVGGLQWRAGKHAEKTTRENLPTPSKLREDLRSDNLGKVVIAAHQLKRHAAHKQNPGFEEAIEILSNEEDTANLRAIGIDPQTLISRRGQAARTSSSSRAPRMVDAVRARQNLATKTNGSSNSMDNLSQEEFDVLEKIQSGAPEEEVRNNLSDIGVVDTDMQTEVIENAQTEEARSAVASGRSTSRGSRDPGAPSTIRATVQVLAEVNRLRNIINEANISQESTVQNIEETINANIDDAQYAGYLQSDVEEVVSRIEQKINSNNAISDSTPVRELGLNQEEVETIQRSAEESGAFVEELGTIDQINNSSVGDVLHATSAINEGLRNRASRNS